MQHKLCDHPNSQWKHCHHAHTFLYLRRTLPCDKWSISRVRAAIWRQTKALKFGTDMDPEEVGYNSCQTFRPLPPIWVQEPFGLNFFAVHDIRLRAKKEEESMTAQQWKKRTRMTQSSDPLNHWIDNYRQDTLPADGVALRSKSTMICYFASPRASLTTAGVYREESDKNLTEAYLRTTVSQFFFETEEQAFNLEIGSWSYLLWNSSYEDKCRYRICVLSRPQPVHLQHVVGKLF